MSSWDESSEYDLVKAYLDKKVLYDKKCSGHGVSKLKAKAWEEISTSLENEVKKCKSKYQSLRKQFLRAKKKLDSGDSNDTTHLWKWFELMEKIELVRTSCVMKERNNSESSPSTRSKSKRENTRQNQAKEKPESSSQTEVVPPSGKLEMVLNFFQNIVSSSSVAIGDFRAKGLPAVAASLLFTSSVARMALINAFSKTCDCVVTKIWPGSINIEVLSKDGKATKLLLQAFSSGDLLDRLKEDVWKEFKDANLKISLCRLATLKSDSPPYSKIKAEISKKMEKKTSLTKNCTSEENSLTLTETETVVKEIKLTNSPLLGDGNEITIPDDMQEELKTKIKEFLSNLEPTNAIDAGSCNSVHSDSSNMQKRNGNGQSSSSSEDSYEIMTSCPQSLESRSQSQLTENDIKLISEVFADRLKKYDFLLRNEIEEMAESKLKLPLDTVQQIFEDDDLKISQKFQSTFKMWTESQPANTISDFVQFLDEAKWVGLKHLWFAKYKETNNDVIKQFLMKRRTFINNLSKRKISSEQWTSTLQTLEISDVEKLVKDCPYFEENGRRTFSLLMYENRHGFGKTAVHKIDTAFPKYSAASKNPDEHKPSTSKSTSGKGIKRKSSDKCGNRPFVRRKFTPDIHICQGCRQLFKNAPPKNGLIICHHEMVEYPDKKGKRRLQPGNGYYHNELKCVKARHETFKMKDVIDY